MIQRATLSDENVRSAMGASMLLGLALFLLTWVIAWPLALLLGRPEFPPIFLALSSVLLLQSLSFPLHGMLRRVLDLKSIAIRTLTATTAGGLVAAWMAWRGFGAWSLVGQQLTVAGVGLLMLLRVSRIRPWPFRFRRDEFAPLLAVARPFMLGQFATQAARRLDTVALGLFLGNHEVGIYFLVTRLIQAAQVVSQFSIGEIALAVLSRLQADPVRLQAGIRRAIRLTGFVCLFCFGGLSLVAMGFVPVLFGAQMADAAEPLRVLALFATGGALTFTCVHVLVSAGAASVSSWLAVVASLVQLVAVFIAARFGMMPLVYAIGIAQLIMVLPAFWLIQRHTGVPALTLVGDQVPIVLGFAAAWWLGAKAILDDGLSATGLGALVFVVLMLTGGAWLFRRDLPLLVRVRQT